MIQRKYEKKMDRGPGSQFETDLVSKLMRVVDQSEIWYDESRQAYYYTFTRDQLAEALEYSPTTKSLIDKIKKRFSDCQLMDPSRDYRPGYRRGNEAKVSEFDVRIPDRFISSGN